jgi:hypothetical protein
MIHVHNAISLARDMQKRSFMGVPQAIILTLKSRLFFKCEIATTKTQL